MSDSGSQITDAGTNEPFDRPISLIDATRPPANDSGGDSRKNSRSPSWRQLAKRPTRNSVRDGLARWKYSKWQQDRYSPAVDQESQSGELSRGRKIPHPEPAQLSSQQGLDHTQTETSDFALRKQSHDRGREIVKGSNDRVVNHKREKESSEIDVLYENQRGWFFFGIPLYSHSSLLNFDPSPWVTKSGKDSAVDITNAQLPDPSWEWAWKSWYVDMSYDVDEEGWQYSFSFSRKFSWHGTHPWFHCLVRRRRWLRKRFKRQITGTKDASDMAAAHTLTSDYFTIHSKRGRSPGSALENTTTRGSSHMSRRTEQEVELPPEDIKDIPSLMKALRLATIDREKIDAVKKFVEAGDDELIYLERRIPDIMDLFVFQTSRRQLLEYLNRILNTSSKDSNPQGRRLSGLRNAVLAADGQIDSLEYWSDRQHVLQAAEKNGLGHGSIVSESSGMTVPSDNNPVDVIKGINKEAEIGIDPTKKVLSTPPENRVGMGYLDAQQENSELKEGDDVEEREDHPTKEVERPIGLPHDSIKVDD